MDLTKISRFEVTRPFKAIQNQEHTFKLVFTKLMQIVKPYKTRSNFLSSAYKASANREAIQNQEQF